jgi:hypothetical protein
MASSIEDLTERLDEAKVDHKKDVAKDGLTEALQKKWEPDRIKKVPLEQECTKKEGVPDDTKRTATTKASGKTGKGKRT